jgi:hypothetical protein
MRSRGNIPRFATIGDLDGIHACAFHIFSSLVLSIALKASAGRRSNYRMKKPVEPLIQSKAGPDLLGSKLIRVISET